MTNEAVPPVPAFWHRAPRWRAGQAPLLQRDTQGWAPVPCPSGLPSIPHPIGAFPLLRTFAISATIPRLGTFRVANAHHFLAFGVSLGPGKVSRGPGMTLTMFLRVVERQLVPGGVPVPMVRVLVSGLGGCLPRAAFGQMFWQMFPGMFWLWAGGRAGPDPPQA